MPGCIVRLKSLYVNISAMLALTLLKFILKNICSSMKLRTTLNNWWLELNFSDLWDLSFFLEPSLLLFEYLIIRAASEYIEHFPTLIDHL